MTDSIDAFISDTHFGHEAILQLAGRYLRASTIEEHDAMIVERYNRVVGHQDAVCWVGDVSFVSPDKTARILRQMNGYKILVRGNHDSSVKIMRACGFDLVLDELMIIDRGVRLRVSHFPYFDGGREGDDRYPDRRAKVNADEVLIHGHTHDSRRSTITPSGGRQIHVGLDAWEMKPVKMDQVRQIIQQRKWYKT